MDIFLGIIALSQNDTRVIAKEITRCLDRYDEKFIFFDKDNIHISFTKKIITPFYQNCIVDIEIGKIIFVGRLDNFLDLKSQLNIENLFKNGIKAHKKQNQPILGDEPTKAVPFRPN